MNVQEKRGVYKLQVLLQNGFRHEGNQEGSGVCTVTRVHTFKSREEQELILYRNFVNVAMEAK